jgi:ubiquinone/menaquinone biosynthesis C-methylase UbiE
MAFWGTLFVLLLGGGLIWRLASRRVSLPCPAWLGRLVEMDNPFFRNHRAEAILALAALRPGLCVLDCGCGPGRLTLPAARAVGPDGRVLALDMQEAMLERVRTRAAREGLANVVTVRGQAGLPGLGADIAPGTADRALLSAVLGEVPDRQALLAGLCQALTAGGLLVVAEVMADPHFVSRGEVRRLAERAGFIEVAGVGGALCHVTAFRRP